MSTPLFRPEAIEARRQQWLGEVRLVRPVSLSVAATLLVLCAIAVGSWLVLGEYTRKAHVRGQLVPDRGWIRLVSPHVGTVAERRVVQGQVVRAGDVLFVLSPERRTNDGATQQRVQREASADNETKHEFVIRAPQDGTVVVVLAEPGQSVAPDAALASLMPADARLLAHLYTPSSALGFIQPEQPVRLRVAAFPHQRYGHQAGQVRQVSSTPLQAGELAALPFASNPNEPLYRVTVTLEQQHVVANGREQPLAAGMHLEADVLLERRRLVEWLFAPVLAIAGRG